MPPPAELIEQAAVADEKAVDLYHFTHLLNDSLDDNERLRMIEMMWTIAYADGAVSEFENNLIWRVADLLGVSSTERIALRHASPRQSGNGGHDAGRLITGARPASAPSLRAFCPARPRSGAGGAPRAALERTGRGDRRHRQAEAAGAGAGSGGAGCRRADRRGARRPRARAAISSSTTPASGWSAAPPRSIATSSSA